mgnify:CR=1 FL=1
MKVTTNQLWAFVNRIEVENPKLTRDRAQSAINVLDKVAGLDVGTYNDMMDAIAYIVRESYRR